MVRQKRNCFLFHTGDLYLVPLIRGYSTVLIEKISILKIHSSPNSKPQFHRLHVVTRVDLKLSAATFQAPSCPQASPCCPSGTAALPGPSSILHRLSYSIAGSLRSSWINITPDCIMIPSPTLTPYLPDTATPPEHSRGSLPRSSSTITKTSPNFHF